MAENNRNRGSNRSSNQDWNENRGRGNNRNWEDDRGYGQSENRGYGNSGSRDYDDSGSAGWQSRYQREEFNRGGGYNTGRQGRSDFDSGNYSNDRDQGYSTYGSGENSYGGGMGSSWGSSYGSGSSGRGLYDRDYENMGRRGNSGSGSRIGGSNYGGGYSDRDRGSDYEGRESNEWRNRDYNEGRGSGYTGYAGSSYYGNAGSSGRSSGRTNSNQGEDRGFWDRASDEVASWFGDDDAERRRERDRQMRATHKGKGPRNYSRSDDRIKEDINDRLSDDPFVDASDIDVTVSNGEVTLSGNVDERSSKRRAEDIAESVSGVKNVENRIRVSTTSGSSGTGVTGMGSSGTTSRSSSTMQNRESQSSESRGTEKEKTTGTNSKKDFVTG